MEISTEGSVAQRAGPRRYIVTGAAGHLGSTIMRQLADAGQDATGLLLPGEKEKVSSPLLRYFEGDVCDIDSLRPLFNGCAGKEVVFIHTAAVISIASRMPAGLYDVNVNGVKNILQICKQYGAKRLVHVSSVHAIPELPKGRVMTEPASFSSDLVVGGYAKTKAEAAQAVMDAAAEGLDVVAVFPSGIVGPFDEGRNHLVQLVLEFMRGALPACVAGGYDFVDVRDVAQGCLQAAVRGRKGEG